MAEVLVAILGNIGSGKSEFVKSLRERGVGSRLLPVLTSKGEIKVYDESPKVKELAANVFYPAFLRGDLRTCFAVEVEMLYARRDQMLDAAKHDGIAVLERTIWENRFVFFENQYRQGFIRSPFYDEYCEAFERVRQTVPTPDVFVYLRTSPSVAFDRMRARARESEKGVPLDYLQSTHSLYDELVDGVLPRYVAMYGDKLVRINADNHLDAGEFQKFHSQVEERIEQALRRQGWGPRTPSVVEASFRS
ncbi:deoxynucleoside kinase [Candidatus Micrarchaeota archaeon]|nr:deoxynucleoside kinase [Candidatus Micrarchaeota archaeon]